jgi:hypothetical protein
MMERCDGANCWSQLDWFCEHAGLARVFRGGAVDHVDPYCYALPFVVRERFAATNELGQLGLVEYVGVFHEADVPAMKKCQGRALVTAMHDAGFGVLSTRIKDGIARTVEICKPRGPHAGRTD